MNARYLFFGGKGGVGKTTAASATALFLLHNSKRNDSILLFSTDPAHSLSDSLDVKVGNRLVATGQTELPRFQQVSETLFRGGQPRDGGIGKLHDLGINTVINLRGASERTRAEEKEVRALGLNYFNVPLPNWARPQHTRVARILELINAPENGRVFIHCKEGVDRTGMIVAIYRMKHDGWSADQALAEAEQSGMRRTQFWMRDYTEDYGKSLHKHGPETALKSPHVDEDFGDRLGNSMRFVERGTFRARRLAGRFLRKFR